MSTRRHQSAQEVQVRTLSGARYYWLLLAEGHLTRRLFPSILRKIAALPSPAG
jgi:hypothetical protein